MKSFFTVFCFLILFMAATFTTSFAQFPWTKDDNNPVMSGGASGTWNRHLMMPNVLYNTDSSRYEMWYTASSGSPWRPYRIGFATSPDGISWTLHPNPVLEPDVGTWDESTVEGPMVLRENGEYKMWYIGWKPNMIGGIGIGYATSPDGINWTKDTQNNPVMGAGTAIWEEGGSGYCTVIPVPGGGYEMWYTGFNADSPVPSETNIGYASSSDGISWQKDILNNPVLTIGTPEQWDNPKIMVPKVVFLNSEYHMWYTGGQIPSGTRKIGWATSVDGIQWNKYSDPVLSATAGQWDGSNVETGTVMLEGDSLRMWYSGWRDPASTYLIRTGHATAPVIVDGIEDYDNTHIPEGLSLKQNYPNPFNPTTNIAFSIPKSEFVTLKVYNIIGQEVATLVSDKLNAGNYSYSWDAGSMASGIYIYTLKAGKFQEVRKMVYLK